MIRPAIRISAGCSARSGMPVLCLPGNHDEPRAMQRELAGAPFVLGGFVDLGRWRIVLLDSCMPGSASGALSAAALAGLHAALASAAGRHCMVCLHHHPVPMSSRWLDRVGLTNAAEFLHTLDGHRNVRAVVWGHVHQAFDALRKGVRLLATPSTCAQFLPQCGRFRRRSAAARLSHPGAARGRIAADGGRVGRRALPVVPRAQPARLPERARRRPGLGHPRRTQHRLPRRLGPPAAGRDAALPAAFDRAYADSARLVMEMDLATSIRSRRPAG